MKNCILCLVFVAFALPVSAQRSVSSVISYQAALSDTSGHPLPDGEYTIGVAIYNSSGDLSIWRDTYRTHAKHGVVSLLLGSGPTPLPDLSDAGNLLLGVRIDGSEELPLTSLYPTPVALTVPSGSITTSKIADRAVTADKMGTEFVGSISLNGEKITGKGQNLNIETGDGLAAIFDPGSQSLVLGTGSSANAVRGKGAKAQSVDPFGSNNGGIATLYNTVAGGQYNTALPSSTLPGYASIIGGRGNRANGTYSTVGGGDTNYSGGIYSTIGGGFNNVAGNSAFVGGGENNSAGSDHSTVGGGRVNIVGASGGVIAGGDSNQVDGLTSTAQGFIGGGLKNRIRDTAYSGEGEEQAQSVIGGGRYNTIWEGPSVIGGGEYNSIWQEDAVVTGGAHNTDSTDFGFIGGGARNSLSSWDQAYSAHIVTGGPDSTYAVDGYSSIVGGLQNRSSAGFTFIGGGYMNSAPEDYGTIPGGAGLTVGAYSFGFSGDSGTSSMPKTDLSSSGANFRHVAYFGDVTVMIGNIDNKARELRFYEPNNGHYSYSGVNYSAFKAGTQSANITYTLPTTGPDSIGRVLGVSSISGTNVGLAWEAGGGGSGGLAGWLLTGNAGTSAGPNFLGTIDSQAMEIHVHDGAATSTGGNMRVMRYEEGATSPNIIGGSSVNSIGSGLSGAAILSGGSPSKANRVEGSLSVIAGGDSNQIRMSGADHNVIGGGLGNIEINTSYGVIAGGVYNVLDTVAWGSVIAGGANDTIEAPLSTIGGGRGNRIQDRWVYAATIGGGQGNQIWHGIGSFLGGGFNNFAGADYNTLAGGYSDSSISIYGFLGGGYFNKIDYGSDTSVLVGGKQNVITASPKSFIGGGCLNQITTTQWGTIAGGCGNVINDTLGFVGGGQENVVSGRYSLIVGGDHNHIFSSDTEGSADYGVIAGGSHNELSNADLYHFFTPRPRLLPQFATIGGGTINKAEGHYATVAGGRQNLALGLYATIPGGLGLVAQDYQTVIGRFNVVTPDLRNGGSINKRPYASHPLGDDTSEVLPAGDLPVFIIGNGNVNDAHVAMQSNAFEVSDNGHSIVHDRKMGHADSSFISSPRIPIYGASYQDNLLVGWGHVQGNHTPAPGAFTILSDFGVKQVTNPQNGVFVITLESIDALGAQINFKNAAITATLEEVDSIETDEESLMMPCGSITSTKILSTGTPNRFIIRTFNNCHMQNRPFFFEVYARP